MNRLREFRGEVRLSQDRLARALHEHEGKVLGIDGNTISRHERGRVVPSLFHQRLYAKFFGVSVETLFPDQWPGATDSVVRPSEAAVTDLGNMLATLRRREDEIGSAPIVDLTLDMARLTETLMRDAVGAVQRELLAVAGQQSQFVGWLYTDLGKHDLALKWYRRSGEQAHEANDADLVSSILSMRSHLSWSKGDPKSAAALGESAMLIPGIAAVVRSQAVQQYARALAMDGDADGIDRYLDTAEVLAHEAVADPDRIPPWLYFHDVSRIGIQRGIAYVEAGRGEDAARVLEEWINRTPAEHIRDRGWNYSRLAVARAMTGDADGALVATQHAAEITMRAPSAHTGAELESAARILHKAGASTIAREIDELTRSVTPRNSR